jgi:hypothetical protein
VTKTKVAKLLLSDFYFGSEADSNYPDNINITFVKKAGWDTSKVVDEKLSDKEQATVEEAVERIGLDPEPILPCVYSGDIYILQGIKRQLNDLGAVVVDLNFAQTDVMALVREQEAQDAADRKAGREDAGLAPSAGGCSGGSCSSGSCGSGSCSPPQFAPEVASTNPSDYYFKAVNDPNNMPNDSFLITPKADWDVRKALCLDHPAIASLLSTNGFEQMQEAEYEYINGSPQSGHALLLSLGFIENLSL